MGYSIRGQKKITYEDLLSDKLLIIAAIRAGIPYSLFHLIQAYTPFTEVDWADFLDISTKSLQRYRHSSRHNFKPLHSEKIIEIAEVTKVGLEVFEDMSKFKLWLNTPNYALGKIKPIELLKDSYGKELVIAELTRINQGILV
ncbi:MAG: antitoxin Xre/MbcA/ParS toxin-binding domain-containing protein [Saprospiraceae bacterium]